MSALSYVLKTARRCLLFEKYLTNHIAVLQLKLPINTIEIRAHTWYNISVIWALFKERYRLWQKTAVVPTSIYSNILPAAIWLIGQISILTALSYLASIIVKGRALEAAVFSCIITNIYVIHWIIKTPIRRVIPIVVVSFLPIAGLPLLATVPIPTVFFSKL